LQQSVDQLQARLRRRLHLIAESDLNDARILRPPQQGGYGLHAQWSDDFHHSLHALLTGERAGYYSDFGDLRHLALTLRQGWFYSGQASGFRGRQHGNSPAGLSRSSFIVCIQNHDQIGNRARGERLSSLVDFETLKLAAGVTALAPFVPLLFMGEEYGETAPFQYFTSHGDPALIEAVRQGRREEFSAFAWEGDIPDPHDENTFLRSKLDHGLESREPHRTLRALYRELFAIRREYSLAGSSEVQIREDGAAMIMAVETTDGRALAAIFEFAEEPRALHLSSLPKGLYAPRLNSSDARWRGPGPGFPENFSTSDSSTLTLAPRSFLLLERQKSNPE
jgi:maltooligosyltrehalose trehalohydrolase